MIVPVILGYSVISLCLLHNLYFSEKFVLFTQSNVHFVYNEAFQNLNLKNYNDSFFYKQITKWNPIYNVHRIFILLFVLFFVIKLKNTKIIYLLFTCMVIQHLVLLITHPDSRYAYLAWLFTFLLFLNFLSRTYLKKFK